MSRIRPVLPLLAVLSLGACGDNDTLWGGESEAEAAERLAEAQAVQVPIQTVRNVEIGRTRDGFLITAYGMAQGLGYSTPTLRPRRGGAPGIDGYIEYDFVASEPPAGFDLPSGSPQMRQLRADLPVSANALRGAAGIRVLGLSGGAQLDFAPPPPPEAG
ncbi:MAG TPA: hypothetical protein VFJ13_07475 [Paracoccaceae bacterium]|nr:hypothetical protein [Paracoccaceae bacterium]